VYIGIFLTPASHAHLVSTFDPIHPKVFAHHLTLWVKSDGTPPNVPYGAMVSLRVIGHVWDDKAQAVLVSTPTGIKVEGGRTPHITISTLPEVPPAYSKDLVREGDIKHVSMTLQGRVGWWNGSEARFDEPDAPSAPITFPKGPGKLLFGFKVMNYNMETKEVVSGANSAIRLPLRVGKMHRMPGAGIFLGNDEQYVMDNYAVHDVNALIKYQFDPADLKYGNLTDREAEIGVSQAKVVHFDLYDADGDRIG
jgi:hypothetical protein